MEEPCELLESCGFFISFMGNAEVLDKGWARMFCQSKEKSENCARNKIYRKTGSPPADNMAPTGDVIRVINRMEL